VRCSQYPELLKWTPHNDRGHVLPVVERINDIQVFFHAADQQLVLGIILHDVYRADNTDESQRRFRTPPDVQAVTVAPLHAFEVAVIERKNKVGKTRMSGSFRPVDDQLVLRQQVFQSLPEFSFREYLPPVIYRLTRSGRNRIPVAGLCG